MRFCTGILGHYPCSRMGVLHPVDRCGFRDNQYVVTGQWGKLVNEPQWVAVDGIGMLGRKDLVFIDVPGDNPAFRAVIYQQKVQDTVAASQVQEVSFQRKKAEKVMVNILLVIKQGSDGTLDVARLINKVKEKFLSEIIRMLPLVSQRAEFRAEIGGNAFGALGIAGSEGGIVGPYPR